MYRIPSAHAEQANLLNITEIRQKRELRKWQNKGSMT